MTSDQPLQKARRRSGLTAATLAIALAWTGCGESIPDPVVLVSRKPIKVDAVPESILKSAKKALAGVKFEEAWSNHDKEGATIAYELRGTTRQGKIRDVRLNVAGDVVETE